MADSVPEILTISGLAIGSPAILPDSRFPIRMILTGKSFEIISSTVTSIKGGSIKITFTLLGAFMMGFILWVPDCISAKSNTTEMFFVCSSIVLDGASNVTSTFSLAKEIW